MTFDHIVALLTVAFAGIGSAVSSIGLIFVAIQLRDSNRQRETESIVKLYDVNRELITLGFSHPTLFLIMEDEPIADALVQKRYLQLWLNQLSLMHTFLQHAVVRTELQEELHRNLADFLSLENMQRHWTEYGMFYPNSFQKRVNAILEKVAKDEPPKQTAHLGGPHAHHDART